jgi:hypothetical protein
VPAILERDEEVLTRNDPRHALNGGLSAGGSRGVTINNVFDPADVLAKALGTKAGEQALINYVQQNGGAFRAALG